MGRLTGTHLMVATTRTTGQPRVAVVMGDRGMDMSPAAALAMSKALMEAALDCHAMGAERGSEQDANLYDMADVDIVFGPPPGLPQ